MAQDKITKGSLKAAASDLGIEGRSSMDTPELAAAVVSELNPLLAGERQSGVEDFPPQPEPGKLPLR